MLLFRTSISALPPGNWRSGEKYQSSLQNGSFSALSLVPGLATLVTQSTGMIMNELSLLLHHILLTIALILVDRKEDR